jgi:hypothetical protein
MQKKWQQSLRIEIPWRQISGNLVHGIGTKKDTGPWFKNILHRNMRLDAGTTRKRGEFRVNPAEKDTKTGTTSGNARNTDQYGRNYAS